jgi:hypothetical protein
MYLLLNTSNHLITTYKTLYYKYYVKSYYITLCGNHFDTEVCIFSTEALIFSSFELQLAESPHVEITDMSGNCELIKTMCFFI